jgi:hypothetical protein
MQYSMPWTGDLEQGGGATLSGGANLQRQDALSLRRLTPDSLLTASRTTLASRRAT